MATMLTSALRAFVVTLAIANAPNAIAQTASAPPSVLPTGGGQALLDTSNSVILLLDHQSGLFQTVKDVDLVQLRANVTMLAKLAALLKIPVITTASEPGGPNGPLMPEIHQAAPHAVYVPRKGEVNAWDNEDFVRIVRATGRKTLIMAGVWTSVCVMFPALDAKAAGFKVYAVMDASGDPSEMASRTTLARFASGGRHPDFDERGAVGNASHLESPGSCRAREALCPGGSELRRRDRELSEGARGREAGSPAITRQPSDVRQPLRPHTTPPRNNPSSSPAADRADALRRHRRGRGAVCSDCPTSRDRRCATRGGRRTRAASRAPSDRAAGGARRASASRRCARHASPCRAFCAVIPDVSVPTDAAPAAGRRARRRCSRVCPS